MWKPAGPKFYARTHTPAAYHNGRFHVVSGWNGISTGGQNFPDSWRSADLVLAEKSNGTPPYPVSFCEMQSLGSKLILAPGYDGSFPPTLSAPDDQVNDFFQVSDDDGENWYPVTPSGMTPHETGALVKCGNSLYDFGGLHYVWPGGQISYAMNHQVWRWDIGQSAPVLANANLPFSRRSFGSCEWNGGILVYGGRDDVAGLTYNDVWFSNDGLQTITQIANGSLPGSLFGCSLMTFPVGGVEHAVVIGGQWSGGMTRAVWTTPTPSIWNSWVRRADLPSDRQAVQYVRMPVNGVDSLVGVGGQGVSGGPALNEIIICCDLDAGWSTLVTSDFMAS